jgi:hypothetical protein
LGNEYILSFHRNIGAAAADRAKIQQEFFLRKQEAAANRLKAQGGFIANNVRLTTVLFLYPSLVHHIALPQRIALHGAKIVAPV